MKIEYYTIDRFGDVFHYLNNFDQAFALKQLTKKLTLDAVDLEALETLGFDLVQVLPPAKPFKAPKPIKLI